MYGFPMEPQFLGDFSIFTIEKSGLSIQNELALTATGSAKPECCRERAPLHARQAVTKSCPRTCFNGSGLQEGSRAHFFSIMVP